MSKNEYIIINKTHLLKKIEELEQIEQELIKNGHKTGVTRGKIDELISLLYQSTPLVPEIEKAFDVGKSDKIGKSIFGITSKDYISNLKLDI